MTELRDGRLAGSPTSPNGHHGFDFGNIISTPQKAAPERQLASPPPSQSGEAPRASTTSNGVVTSGIVDFFSPEVFQIVLHNPATAHQLLRFSQARMSGENMEFLERVCLSTYRAGEKSC